MKRTLQSVELLRGAWKQVALAIALLATTYLGGIAAAPRAQAQITEGTWACNVPAGYTYSQRHVFNGSGTNPCLGSSSYLLKKL